MQEVCNCSAIRIRRSKVCSEKESNAYLTWLAFFYVIFYTYIVFENEEK